MEDESAILTMIVKILEGEHYTVLDASSPDEAVLLAKRHAGDIHVLLSDVVMPEMNGLELAQLLVPIYPDLQRMYMSGHAADVLAHKGVMDEEVRSIQKPFTKTELVTRIRLTLNH